MEKEKINNEIEQLVKHLQSPRQIWLLGAGISCKSGIPLMIPLTNRLKEELSSPSRESFEKILELLHDNSHVEHVLSQIGDLIEIAGRSKDNNANFGNLTYSKDELTKLHNVIVGKISDIIRRGYSPKTNDTQEEVGTLVEPIVRVDHHRKFVHAIFYKLRANLERRPAVKFFTTNYDTLLEDALSLERIDVEDGFTGGTMAYWKPEFEKKITKAKVYKLHGSIDWYIDEKTRHLFRYREGSGYPDHSKGRILIYPQSTKYVETQRDPFAHLFSCFREALLRNEENTLVICGYSFGDEHINAEIENSLNNENNKTTLIAFVRENENGLPEVLERWLSEKCPIREKGRIFVATNKGLYQGNKLNLYDNSQEKDWWTFEGLTRLLEDEMSYFDGDLDE